ncbi:neuropeptide-like 1 isoform X2 [Agrilus planipennis]|uniref:Neuropeptide-like 1 isoform X2 n=1 Tax=Agrilus planipennis TaxID=224129 RepID=A0A1W4WXT9_AGRPL|nr:neuropeptide-like 1 isoform X2 [Agrilus planipennis]
MFSLGCLECWSILVLLPSLVKLEEVPSKQPLSSCELEKLLHPLVSPTETQSLQVQALRQQLARLLEQHLHNQVDDNSNDKRSLESLARGGYIRNIKDISYNDEPQEAFRSGMRSFMGSGQFPYYSQLVDSSKRSIESLARNGELIVPNKSDDQNPEVPTKKGIGSLERDFNFPTYGKRFAPEFYGKRNVASIARSGLLPGKRAHVRDYLSGIDTVPGYDELEEKRNLASVVKSHYPYRFKRSVEDGSNNVDNDDNDEVVRFKRMAAYFDDNEQNTNQNEDDNVVDYEELIQELNDIYPIEDKRFLGRLPQMGKPKTTTSPKTRFR